MLFSSIPFLYYFLPIVLLLYFIVPTRGKNLVLFLSSLFFYAWGEPMYVFLMVATILIGYILGLLIGKYQGTRPAKVYMILSVVINLGFLGYFKYAGFFTENFAAVTGLSVPVLRIALPIGISFYTFQLLSYLIDVYRGEVPAQKNPLPLATYIALFPQLIAGPIVRYQDVAEQLNHRRHTLEKTSAGIQRFLLGLGKKVLLANAFGELIQIFRASDDLSVLFYWLYAISFTLQIYFDFSGYSDMAIGLGHIFGFDFLENFNYPYISKSITEFWRRWHMSLGTWFRDYVYIPLGGNRCSRLCQFRNIFVVWMLTGFWHGASWNFIVWGLFFAVILMLEKSLRSRSLSSAATTFQKKTSRWYHTLFCHAYVLLLVCISFVIFDAASLTDAAFTLGSMFGWGDLPLLSAEALYYLRSYGWILVLALIGATPLPKQIFQKLESTRTGDKLLPLATPILLAVLLLIITAYLVDGSYNPFLYFRF